MTDTITFAPEKFAQIVKQMKTSVNAKNEREFLRDVIIEVNRETIAFIGTDGYRMSISKISFDQGDMYNVYSIPVQEFVGCASKVKMWKKINIQFKDDTIWMSDGNERIVLISNKPPYKPDFYYKLIPTPKLVSTVIFSPEEVMEFVKELPKIIREATGKKRITSPLKFPVQLSALNFGKMEVAILIDKSVHTEREFRYENLIGEPFNICFNPKFFEEALSLFERKVALTFNGDREAVVMRNVDNESFIHVLMPIIL